MKKAATRADEWEKVVSREGRANHSVANAGNPSQGQDQSVNPVQSTEGLAPCTTNDLSPLVRTLVLRLRVILHPVHAADVLTRD